MSGLLTRSSVLSKLLPEKPFKLHQLVKGNKNNTGKKCIQKRKASSLLPCK